MKEASFNGKGREVEKDLHTEQIKINEGNERWLYLESISSARMVVYGRFNTCWKGWVLTS